MIRVMQWTVVLLLCLAGNPFADEILWYEEQTPDVEHVLRGNQLYTADDGSILAICNHYHYYYYGNKKFIWRLTPYGGNTGVVNGAERGDLLYDHVYPLNDGHHYASLRYRDDYGVNTSYFAKETIYSGLVVEDWRVEHHVIETLYGFGWYDPTLIGCYPVGVTDGSEIDSVLTIWRFVDFMDGARNASMQFQWYSEDGEPLRDLFYRGVSSGIPTGAVYLNDDTILVSYRGYETGLGYHLRLVRFNGRGVEQANQVIWYDPSQELASYRHKLIHAKNGDILNLAGLYDENEDEWSVYVSKWTLNTPESSNGGVAWSVMLDEGHYSDLVVDADGNYFCLVYDEMNDEHERTYTAYTLSAGTGEILAQQEIPDLAEVNVVDIESHPNGLIFLLTDSLPWYSSAARLYTYGDPAAVEASPARPAQHFQLHTNYPNPFNGTTTFEVDLPAPSPLMVTVYDLLGRPVRVLHDGPATPGSHQFALDGRNLPSGTYLLRAEAGDEIRTQRITLVK